MLLFHTDYSHKGASIRISIFDDRIEVENPGILLPGLTLEDLLNGLSKLRNKVIGRIFKKLNLVENWGSGIKGIFNAANEFGLPHPKIEEIGMRIRFTIYLSNSLSRPFKSPIKSKNSVLSLLTIFKEKEICKRIDGVTKD